MSTTAWYPRHSIRPWHWRYSHCQPAKRRRISNLKRGPDSACHTRWLAGSNSRVGRERARRSTLVLLLACSVADGETVTAALPNQSPAR